jgi:hypothetical protein
MKIHCIVGMYIAFIVALIFGFNSGSAIASAGDEIANAFSKPMTPSSGSQHNILLIQVNQLDSDQPYLRSVWLMAYYTNNPRVDLLPIYPTDQPTTSVMASNLADRFTLTSNGEPSEVFWLGLQEYNTWWNGYVMMDDLAIQKLLEQLADSPLSGSPTEKLGGFHISHPQAAIEDQIDRYQELCQSFSMKNRETGFYRLLFSLKDHTRSNLKPGQLRGVWQQLESHGAYLTCNFPSLQAAITE